MFPTLLIIFLIGLFVGSFLNVISDRVVRNEAIFFGRSHCDTCKHKLAPKDLVPLLSFIFIKGKCRYCKTKLSVYYPTAEILTGLVFVLAYFTKSVLPAVVFCAYIVLFLTDAKYTLIPNKVVIPAIIFVFGFLLVTNIYTLFSLRTNLENDALGKYKGSIGKYLLRTDFYNARVAETLKHLGLTLFSSLSISLFFIFLIFITKGRGMGGGDVTLGFLIGLFNGFPTNILAIFLGFLFGTIFSLGLILTKQKSIKDTIPFGPFLIVGSVVAYFFGKQLLSWYFGLF